MMKGKNIGYLIEKFRNGSVSDEELSVLLGYFKENEPEGELLEFYEQVWNRTSGESAQANPERSFPGLLSEINQEGGSYEKPVRLWSNIWKYAALIVVTFSIAWLANNLVHNRNSGNVITYQNIEVPYGSRSKVELPDGSKVTLNAGSRLRYENGFGNSTRIVFLEGEAFFDVKKDSDHPFYVNTLGVRIKVTGTTFDVKAYPEEDNIEATLITGRVQMFMSNDQQEERPAAILYPGQKALYEKGKGREIRVSEVPKPELAIAWADDQFVFDNVSFEELSVRIARWYNVEIILNYPALKTARFSGRFDKETIEQAMKALTLVTPFHFSIEKNRITINK
jgi:ferric-dicitrate binding protein FerR (iron transport regulator)